MISAREGPASGPPYSRGRLEGREGVGQDVGMLEGDALERALAGAARGGELRGGQGEGVALGAIGEEGGQVERLEEERGLPGLDVARERIAEGGEVEPGAGIALCGGVEGLALEELPRPRACRRCGGRRGRGRRRA